ncbi:MAG: molybdopterin molybdenumtransferase MoeA [Chitinophagaceae bacterium]|nr:MAG: molybdopterin molybdenumtransferase MoeA [Chitinophagaceae bacterium]
MEFITVEQAESIIQSHVESFRSEEVPFESSWGRILAEDIFADRDLPPFNHPTVDGIAIQFGAWEEGILQFNIKATQAAGEHPVGIENKAECVEIMTGAALHNSVDTVIRYEDLRIENGIAVIRIPEIKKAQNVHPKGKDKRQGEKVAEKGIIIDAVLTGLAASVGKTKLSVMELPHIVIITTGNEMVSADTIPSGYQLRRSNDYMIKTALKSFQIHADTVHLQDDPDLIKTELNRCLQAYDVILLSGGVSMGKFDYVPEALRELRVEKLFHKVRQRPGKPFWFGKYEKRVLVFAFPGNPVSGFMCLHRYFIPWLKRSLQWRGDIPEFAILANDIYFPHPLQYFAQVKLSVNKEGKWLASPLEGNGSGDFINLLHTNAFMELPLEKDEFKKGEVFRVWRYNN